MRREHKLEQSYIDWLKSLGCVFYCPFNQTDGTTDLINNVQLVLTGNGSCTYDSTESMYKVVTPSNRGLEVGKWNNGLSPSWFPTDEYTVLYWAKKITSASNKNVTSVCPVSEDDDTGGAFNVSYNGTTRTNAWPSTMFKYAYANGTSSRTVYQNGTLYNTYSPHSPFFPSNWITTGDGLYLSHVQYNHPYYTIMQNVQFYVSEVYIFNRILDLQQIKQIQQIQ